MDLSPYLEALRRDLAAAAAPGGADVSRAAELLASSLEASIRLCLLEALTDAAAEITAKLGDTSVEVRLRGRGADLVVTEAPPAEPHLPPPPAPAATDAGADLARITLRLPEPLKEQVEQAANAEGLSVNAWLIRAIAAAVHRGPQMQPPSAHHRIGRRVTGFAQA
jgi:hypothetical protein